MLEWSKRAKIRDTDTCTQRRYYSKCKKYVAVELKRKYGQGKIYYAIEILANGNERLINKDARTIAGAMKKCEEVAKL
jgi:type 1 glutamine amidotransferase